MGISNATLGRFPEIKGTMTTDVPEMIDIVFELSGESIPASYPFSLWAGLVRFAPQLEELRYSGILPLRLSVNSEGMLIPRRAKLVLRIPAVTAENITGLLSEQLIELEGKKLQLGKGTKRVIQSYPTLHAQMVAGNTDEILFIEDINTQLTELGLTGNLICGKRHILSNDQQTINGFSLVIHDLKPESSLKLQYAGLGGSRQFGCGIFIPYKLISGLSDN